MNKAILLLEDEEHDLMFMQLALEEAKVSELLIALSEGREAVAYLEGKGKYADRVAFPWPRLILLDMKLPYVPGLALLKKIRENPETAAVPVIVFSSIDHDIDVEAAYAGGANAFVVKPGYTELVNVVRQIKRYWLDLESPPPGCKEWEAITVPRPDPARRRVAPL